MRYDQLIEFLFYGIISYSAWDLTQSVRKAKDSIDQLNIKVAEVLEKVAGHEKTIDQHENRIQGLEKKKRI